MCHMPRALTLKIREHVPHASRRAFLAWMLKLSQIKPPGVHFGAFLAWMPKLTQIEPPRVHFGAFLAWMLKLIQIKPPGVHSGAFLAWMPKLTQIKPPGDILEHFWPGCQNTLKSNLLGYILKHEQQSLNRPGEGLNIE